MPQPENIIYQHVISGAGTILTGQQDISVAPMQLRELQAAVVHAKQLFQAEGYKAEDYKEDDLQQIVQLYNATVTDGRFIDELATDPKSVAARLGVELSDSAAEEFTRARTAVVNHFGGVSPFLPKRIIAIAIVVVIAIAAKPESYDVVIDSSGVVKL